MASTESAPGGTTWNITGSQSFIAGSQTNFTQNNNGGNSFDVESVKQFVELVRRTGDMLGLPDGQRAELIRDVEAVEVEVGNPNPDEGRLRSIGTRIRGILYSSPDSVAQQMLLTSFGASLGALLGG
jgi:hypothetical protein